MTIFSDLLSVDPLGFDCIPADMLDAAMALADKPVLVPRTCAEGLAQPAPDWLSWALGHVPSQAEWVSTWVHWLQATGGHITAPPPYVIAVVTPAPPSVLALLTAVVLLIIATRGLRP